MIISAQADEDEYATFSWAETTFSTSLSQIWDGEAMFQNYTGTYSDNFTVMNQYINRSDDTYVEEKRTVDYSANYSYYYNRSIVGSYDLDFDINVYRVNVDYGSSAQLIWMAVKKGFFEVHQYIETRGYNMGYNETNHQIINKEIKKYDLDTLELLNAWNETEIVDGKMNYTVDQRNSSMYELQIYNMTFTKPFFLTFQIYETEKGDRIAWASFFSEFLVFSDKDGDGIYSVGDFDNPPSTLLNIRSSRELEGWLMPEAYEYAEYREYPTLNHTSTYSSPIDKSVDEVASSIVFTPPSLSGNDTVIWNIDYQDFPIEGFIGRGVPPEQRIDTFSPSDFSYGFDYKIGEGKADLSLTLGLPAFNDFDTYNILEEQNYGLAIPRYDYFLSSFDINEINPKEITIPAEEFLFESNNDTIAEINLMNPIKKNYTLYDYPNEGEVTTCESRGASINNMVMAYSTLQFWHPEVNFLFAIEEIVKDIPEFTVVDNLYHVHTENYPVWAGKRLVHDPTDIIYFENITLAFRIENPMIFGYSTTLVLSSMLLATLVITLKLKKIRGKIRNNKKVMYK